MQAEQQVTFRVGGGLRAVQVPRNDWPGFRVRSADETGDHAVLAADGEHDAVTEVVNESSAGGPAGQPCCLDRPVTVAQVAEVVGKCRPSGGGIADAPLRHGRTAQSTGREVARDPAAFQMAHVELLCLNEDAADV